MATQLKNILAFNAVGAGAQAALPHGLNVNGHGVKPDNLDFDNGEFSFISADETNIVMQNDGAAPGSVNVLVEHWHTIERAFGPSGTKDLAPQPFVGGAGGGGGGGVAEYLGTTGADVDVGSAAPPVAGQVLKATDATHAQWLADSGVSNPLILATGNGTVTAPAGFASGAIGHGIDGDVGTADVNVDPAASGLAIGWVDSYAGGVAQVEAAGKASFALGYARTDGALTSRIYAKYGGSGAFGYARAVTNPASVYAYGPGAFASGVALGGGATASIGATGRGAFASGMAYGSRLSASGYGSHVSGYSSSPNGYLSATGKGAVASGCALNDYAYIQAAGDGAFAHGYAKGYAGGGGYAFIRANREGSTAWGYTSADAAGTFNGIFARYKGDTAWGAARGIYGGFIQARESQGGATAFGYAGGQNTNPYGAYIQSEGRGSLAGGFSYNASATNFSLLRARRDGVLAFGVALEGGRLDTGLLADGATVLGYANTLGYLFSDADGGMARGYVSDQALIKNGASGKGSFASGYATGLGSQVYTNGYGAHAHGYAASGGYVGSSGSGSMAVGYASGGGKVYSTDPGTLAVGWAAGNGVILADGDGSFALGFAYDGALIRSRFQGSIASGFAYHNNSSIYTSHRGAVALGRVALSGRIAGAEYGALANGNAYGGYAKIIADGLGSFASGDAQYGGTISGYGQGSLTVGYAYGNLSLVRTGGASKGCWAGGYSKDGARVYTRVLAKACMSFGYSRYEGAAGTGINSKDKGSAAFGYCNCGPNQANAQVYAEGDGCFALGNAYNNAPSGSLYSSVHAANKGSFAHGYATNVGIIYASGAGAFAGGYVNSLNAGLGAPALIEASYEGAFAHGVSRRDSDQNSRAYMRAMEAGAWVGGYCRNFTAGYYSRVDADKKGSFAHGYARDGYVLATGRGAHAFGDAIYNYSSVEAAGSGSFVMGTANGSGGAGSYIVASGTGGFAGGAASNGYGVFAGSTGSFAFGAATAANVFAVAQNAFQFGEGVNSTQDTVQIGAAGLRLKQTTGAPGAYQNGDIWVANNYVYIRSNGVSCKCVNAAM